MMNHDDIIKEVRTIREQLAAQHSYNVRALFAAAKERQQESERKVVKLVPKPVEGILTSPIMSNSTAQHPSSASNVRCCQA